MTFDCPKCGAPVSYEAANHPQGGGVTVRCGYCSSSLMVPDELRGRPAQIISEFHLNLGNGPATARASRGLWLLLLIPLFGILIAVVAVAGVFGSFGHIISSTRTVAPGPPPGTRSAVSGGPVAKPANNFASVLIRFGSEGIGPGMFKDARSIAVDGDGRIYVGDYSGGRIQVFDPEGKFLTQWLVDVKMPLRALAADRKGTVYVVQSGTISRYEGATGKLLGPLSYSGGWGFDDVIATADGGLVTAWYKNRDDIVRFNSSGQPTRTIHAAISSVTDDSELDTRIAADGLGNIYALGTFNNAVFKFTSDGKFANKFGSAGDQPGQFRAPGAIAVDGKGRIYVSDIKGIQVFDANGRYLQVFKPDGVASGMFINDKNELFVAARNHVIKFALQE